MFDSVKVFTTTRPRDRTWLGETITEWLRNGPKEIVDCVVRQSSDSQFHCLSFIFFYKE